MSWRNCGDGVEEKDRAGVALQMLNTNRERRIKPENGADRLGSTVTKL